MFTQCSFLLRARFQLARVSTAMLGSFAAGYQFSARTFNRIAADFQEVLPDGETQMTHVLEDSLVAVDPPSDLESLNSSLEKAIIVRGS